MSDLKYAHPQNTGLAEVDYLPGAIRHAAQAPALRVALPLIAEQLPAIDEAHDIR